MRNQVLLIAFCFGCFLEGTAGFGTPGYIKTNIKIDFPINGINEKIMKLSPVVAEATSIKAIFSIPLVSTTSAIIVTAILTIIIYKLSVKTVLDSAKETFKELGIPILTICSVLAFAYICNHSGISSTLGLAFASTGTYFLYSHLY